MKLNKNRKEWALLIVLIVFIVMTLVIIFSHGRIHVPIIYSNF